MGYNGAGKTTLTKLLMRLYDAKEGSITLDQIDIRDYDVEAYRNNIGAVFQDYRIYAATVQENVVMDNTKEEDTEKVLSSNLSGGESQKLAVARGFFKNTNLIILDEPSSALDPIAEYNLNKFMFEAAKNKTVIFISHRLSTTRKGRSNLHVGEGKNYRGRKP